MPIALVNDARVLFIHIPKTGGSSVERYLSDHGPILLKGNGGSTGFRCSAQHLHAEALTSIDADKGCDWIFTIVRHPVTRLTSEYRYQMRKPGWLRSRLSFSAWLSYAFARRAVDPYYRDNHFRPQHEFVMPGTRIMRFEDGIDVCLARIAERLGLPPPSGTIHEKPSPGGDVTLTPATLRKIEHVYRRDLELFGYDIHDTSADRMGAVHVPGQQ